MQQVCEQLGLNATHTLDGNRLHLESEVVVWVPRALFGGMTSNFTNIAGKWDARTLSLEIMEHETTLSSSSSSSEADSDLEANESWFETDLESRSATRARRASNRKPKKRERETLLEGRMRIVKILSRGPNSSVERQDVDIEGIETAGRFDVPADRSIPFVLTSDELRRFKEGTDETASYETQSTATQQRMESSQELSTVGREGATASGSLNNSPSAFATTSISSSFHHVVQEMRKTTRVVYTWGTIGLKWLNRSSGSWTYVAFRSTDDCFVWMTLLRKIIVSHLRFQTFHEVFQVKLQFDSALTLQRPDLRSLMDVFMSQDDSKQASKSNDPRMPPTKGFLTFRNGDRVNKWHIFLDKRAVPNTTHPSAVQVLHCVKVGKTLIEGPRNSLLNFTRAHVASQDIDLRKCTIHVPKPFSNQFFLEQRQDSVKGVVVSRLEAVADSMEGRIAWEEWLQTFGATKVLSEEEAVAKANILGGTMHENTFDDDVGEVAASEDILGATSASPEGKRRHRQSGRTTGESSPFAWLTSAPSVRPRSSSLKSGSSEHLGSPVSRSPSPSKLASTKPDGASGSKNRSLWAGDVTPPGVQYALPEVLRNANDHRASPTDESCGEEPHEVSLPPLPPGAAPNGLIDVEIQIDSPTPQLGPSSPQPHEKSVAIELPGSITSRAAVYLDAPSGDENSPITPKAVKLTSPHSSEELLGVESKPPSVALAQEEPVVPSLRTPSNVHASSHNDVAETVEHVAAKTDEVTLKWVLAQQTATSSSADRKHSLLRKAASAAAVDDHENHEPQPSLHNSISHGSMEFSALIEGIGTLGGHRTRTEASQEPEEDGTDATTERATSLLFDVSRGFFQQDPISVQDLKRSFLDSLASFRRGDTPDQLHADGASQSTAPTRVRHQRRPSADSTSSSALGSDDAELVAGNPALRKAVLSNLSLQRMCPLCGADKREVSICTTTRRKHVPFGVVHTTTNTRDADGIDKSLSFPPPQQQQRRFVREPNEPTEVAAARILLELE